MTDRHSEGAAPDATEAALLLPVSTSVSMSISASVSLHSAMHSNGATFSSPLSIASRSTNPGSCMLTRVSGVPANALLVSPALSAGRCVAPLVVVVVDVDVDVLVVAVLLLLLLLWAVVKVGDRKTLMSPP